MTGINIWRLLPSSLVTPLTDLTFTLSFLEPPTRHNKRETIGINDLIDNLVIASSSFTLINYILSLKVGIPHNYSKCILEGRPTPKL